MLDIISVDTRMRCNVHRKPAVAKVTVNTEAIYICLMCLGRFNKQVSNTLSHIIDWKEQA